MILKEKKILLGVTGGIAAYKAPELLRLFQKKGALVRVVLTQGAEAFISPLTFEALTREKVITQDDFLRPQGGFIPHIDLGRWAEAIVVTPATAAFLSGLAMGDASSVLTAIIMASKAPVLLCPAMNKRMWQHPATQENISRLKSYGYAVLSPEEGALACGERGPGRLPSLETILAFTERLLAPKDLSGKTVLVTAGPTREPIDRVRFISNRSSGRMGVALAYTAWLRGATVFLIHGPLSVTLPPGVEGVPVETAKEMLEAVKRYLPQMDILVMAAAVADFVVKAPVSGKIKKQEHLNLELVKAPDLLQSIKDLRRPGQIIVGFAAEEGRVLRQEAERKLKEKALDLIVANDISRRETGFEVETNEVLILDRLGREKRVSLAPKSEIAWAIWDQVLDYERRKMVKAS